MLQKEKLEEALLELPLLQYEFITPSELTFTERIRHVCEMECPRYGKTWACPPAVGSIAQCQANCFARTSGLMVATMAEVSDIANMEETLATRGPHEDITRQVRDLVEEMGGTDTYTLSTESCEKCKFCTYPHSPCRFPNEMFPCVESHGIIVTDLAEKYEVPMLGGNFVTWISLVLFTA